jgi:putative PIN family toxin of toxin-antitoxin system
MLKVVIDTNVFISAFYLPESRPAEAVLGARRKRVRNFISPEILEEVERIIKTKLLWDHTKTQSAIQRIKGFSEMVYHNEHLTVIADDPDNRILECALKAQADLIISGDKHLLNLRNYQGIKMVTPGEFLESLQ